MGFLDILLKKKRIARNETSKNPVIREQNEMFELMSKLCDDGVDADEFPNGQGEFGLSALNPIPCHTTFGSTLYLTRLRSLDGSKVKYVRRGSTHSSITPKPVDIYEISDLNGKILSRIFISPYQKRISRRAPSGFTISIEPT